VLLRVEVSPEVRLELEGSDVVGFEGSAILAERDLRPAMWAELLEAYQEAVLDHACGARRRPLERGRRAPFRCPACGRERGFKRRGRRSRPRVLLTRLGRMELSLSQVGCRCGRRFAPLLQLLGVDAEPSVTWSCSPGVGARDRDPLRQGSGPAPDRDRPRGVGEHRAKDRGSCRATMRPHRRPR
jgi:hypothetical protein